MTYTFNIEPKPAIRMIRSDKWKKRPIVEKYFAYKNELNNMAISQKFKCDGVIGLEFHLQMPKYWSKKKKELLLYQPHCQTPDLDNLIKGVLDSLFYQDNFIHQLIEPTRKIWANEYKIIITTK